MDRIEFEEGETIEFKRQWTEKALEDIAAFSNTNGGVVFIGIDREGNVVGFKGTEEDIQKISNQISSNLGITPRIIIENLKEKPILKIIVEPARFIVSYKGRYLKRVGSTNRNFPPHELAARIVELQGKSWDLLPSNFTVNDLDNAAFKKFTDMAKSKIVSIQNTNTKTALQNLNLIDKFNLRNGTILLFGKDPQKAFPQAKVTVGLFTEDGTEILDHKEFEGNLWEQLTGVINYFQYALRSELKIQIDGLSPNELQHKETWEYPLEALRELLINALIHRDYTSQSHIQIRIYPDRIEFWNPGELPPNLKPENLLKEHPSIPRNPLLARIFFYAGFIEQWGTGTLRVIKACQERGFPVPRFENIFGGFRATIYKEKYPLRELEQLGLTSRQLKIIQLLKTYGKVTIRELKKHFPHISDKTLRRDLQNLIEMELIEAIGEKKGRFYVLKN